MSLSHDKDGFLQGEPIEIDHGNFARALEIWQDIRGDTASIRSSLGKSVRDATKPAGRTQAMPVAVPRRTSRAEIANIARITSSVSPNTSNKSAGKAAVPNVNRIRDDKGRFSPLERSQVPRPSLAKSAASQHDWRVKFSGGEAGAKSQGALTRSVQMLGGAASKLSNIANNTQHIDPAIAAANEIKGVISPVVGAFRRDKGAEETKKTIPWFRRIWDELRALNKKPGGGGTGSEITDLLGGGGRGLLGGLLGGAGGKLLRAGAGLLRFLGPVAAVAGSAFGGWKLGGWLNDKVINPGIERLTGNKGESIGSWAHDALHVNDINDKDFGRNIIAAKVEKTFDQMLAGWNTLTNFIKDQWQGSFLQKGLENTKRFAGSIGNAAADLGNRANDNIKRNTGIDVIQSAKGIAGKIGERWDAAKGYLTGASDKAGVDRGTVAKIAAFESGFNPDAAPIRKDGSKISSAHGYGQFLDGTWTEMVNKYGAKYGVEGAGKLTKEQAAKLRGDKALQASMLAEFTRENVEKGRKFGGKDDDANVYAFHNLGDGDARKLLSGMKDPNMSVRDALMQGVKDEKGIKHVEDVISGNKSLYGDGGISAEEAYRRMGQKMRQGEKFALDAKAVPASVQSVLMQSSIAPVTAMPASVARPSAAPNISKLTPPPIPELPPTKIGGSGAGDRSVTVNIPREVGQNVSDRGIAQVVTGGIGGYVA